MLPSFYYHAVFWIIGITFVSSFAMTLSRVSGSTRFFEAIYIIVAGDHPVILKDTQGEEITLSLREDAKQIGTLEKQSLNINLQPQNGFINVNEPSKLIVGIPCEWVGNVDVTVESGTDRSLQK